MNYSKVGQLISKLRKEKGMTQLELADKLGITDRAVSKWECGKGCPDVSLLDDLSKILDVSILEILKGKRLETDEIINNNAIIESMNYSKETFKNKIKIILNTLIIAITVVITIYIMLMNLLNIFYTQKHYRNKINDKNIFISINEKISVIKKTKGVYSDNDYKIILNYIYNIEKRIKEEKSEYYYLKNDYSYENLVNYSENNSIISYFKRGYENTIYPVLYKYDNNIYNDMLEYYRYNEIFNNMLSSINIETYNVFSYGSSINKNIAENISILTYFSYSKEDNILKAIIKVGEINE